MLNNEPAIRCRSHRWCWPASNRSSGSTPTSTLPSASPVAGRCRTTRPRHRRRWRPAIGSCRTKRPRAPWRLPPSYRRTENIQCIIRIIVITFIATRIITIAAMALIKPNIFTLATSIRLKMVRLYCVWDVTTPPFLSQLHLDLIDERIDWRQVPIGTSATAPRNQSSGGRGRVRRRPPHKATPPIGRPLLRSRWRSWAPDAGPAALCPPTKPFAAGGVAKSPPSPGSVRRTPSAALRLRSAPPWVPAGSRCAIEPRRRLAPVGAVSTDRRRRWTSSGWGATMHRWAYPSGVFRICCFRHFFIHLHSNFISNESFFKERIGKKVIE